MNLTYRYSAIQFTHWASSTGAAVFATTYLLDKGIHSGVVGVLLALAGICSCLTQPVLASFADRTEKVCINADDDHHVCIMRRVLYFAIDSGNSGDVNGRVLYGQYLEQ